MAFNAVSVPINTQYNDRGIEKAEKELNKLGKTLDRVAGRALKASANFVFLQGGRALFDFGVQSVNNARDLERNLRGIEVVFKDLSPQMIQFTEQAYQLGLSQVEAAKATTFIGSVLKQSGFALRDTADLTQHLISLAADLSIVYGYDMQEALLGMTALFRGEYDPIEKFGVAMKQSEIDTEKARLKLDGYTGAQERFIDQLIRVRFLFERAQDAQGAFANSTDTLFASQRILLAEFENMKTEIGNQLVPVLANLATLIRSELLPVIGPMLEQVFVVFINLIQNLIERKDELVPKIKLVIQTIIVLTNVFSNITKFILNNINGLIGLGTAMLAFFTISKGVATVTALMNGLRGATWGAVGAQAALNAVASKNPYIAIASLVVGLGASAVAANAFSGEMAAAEAEMEKIAKQNDELLASLNEEGQAGALTDGLRTVDEILQEAMMGADALSGSMDGVADAAGGAASALQGVAGFYNKLYDEAEKQAARAKLQTMGATEGLIEAVLGSGEEWRQVFASVVQNGIQSVREVQALFAQTKAGFDEAMAEWEQNVWNPFEQWRDQALQARDAMLEFIGSIEILPTINRELGKFEQAAASNLQRIEEDLADAFDNEYLLEESYKNLLKYARDEFAVLQQIERQRDELMARRDAAAKMIESVTDSIVAGARIVDVLRNVENAADKVDIASIVKKTVEDSRNLKEFEVIVTSAVVDPIEEVVSKSQQLVQGYRDIVERTRAFVSNMKALRALGLDPTLFNELVQAGVDAGGATAEALIEGGTETVTEVNNLFAELNSLGEQLGEETAQVMYGQGESFVDGIVKGLEAQASQLEEQAKALAGSFTSTFEEMLVAGIEAAIAAAEAALARMPRLEGMPEVQRRRDDTPSGPVTSPVSNLAGVQTPLLPKGDITDLSRKLVTEMSRNSGTTLSMGIRFGAEGSTPAVPFSVPIRPTTPDRRTPSQINIYSSSRADASSVAKTLTTYSSKNNSTYLRSTAKRNLR